jgi:pimeloyl-ACP methyl ester carboxylesterase
MHYRSLGPAFVAFILSAAPTQAADETFDSNGVKIRYVTAGKGEAVVFIHGWLTDSNMWGTDWLGNTKLKTTSADGFQLIALDCRGHGKSDKPHDVAKYGPEMAADVVRLLDHLKIEKAHLIGYSMGSYIAGKVVATHPERVLSVVYAAEAPLIAGMRSETKSPPEATDVDVFAKAVDEGKDLGAFIIAVSPPDKPKPTEERAKAMATLLFAGDDVKAYAAAGRGFKNLAVTEAQLAKCQAPILFIHGARESDDVKARVIAVRRLLGRGEVKIIESGDHISTASDPDFAAALLEFLGKNKRK